MKKNAVYAVKKVTRVHYRKKDQAKVLRDEFITLEYHPETSEGKRDTKTTLALELRKVSYQDERNRYYDFLTNNFDMKQKRSRSFTRKDGVSRYCSRK